VVEEEKEEEGREEEEEGREGEVVRWRMREGSERRRPARRRTRRRKRGGNKKRLPFLPPSLPYITKKFEKEREKRRNVGMTNLLASRSIPPLHKEKVRERKNETKRRNVGKTNLLASRFSFFSKKIPLLRSSSLLLTFTHTSPSLPPSLPPSLLLSVVA